MPTSVKSTTTVIIIIMLGMLLAGVILGAAMATYSPLWTKPTAKATAQQPEKPLAAVTAANTTTLSSPVPDPHTLVSIFNETENSVVQITSKVSVVNNNIIINGDPLQSESTRLGSGFVYDAQGLIVTNNHVVDGARTVDVTFTDGNTYSAKVLGTDAYSDLAVIKITDNFTESLEPLKLGNSNDLHVGDQVAAIGNPFGLSNTMTTGIVSQLGRLIPNEGNNFSIPDIIQTDAAINPGNSGGPLLNMQGEVIGVNSAIRSDTGSFSGIGFAIPSSAVQRIIPALIKDGKYDHPWLGISGTSLNPELADKLGLPKNSKGVLVTSVAAGGPAQKAGIRGTEFDGLGNIQKPGDIVRTINGQPVKRIEDVITYFEEHTHPGDIARFGLTRAGGQNDIQLNVTLEPRPGPH
jgi:S1-C subfamily serine protease